VTLSNFHFQLFAKYFLFNPLTPELTLNLLKSTIVAPPSNASKWQMEFNSAIKGLNPFPQRCLPRFSTADFNF
jgi:hypothetical protein